MNVLMLSWNSPGTHGGIERLVGDLHEYLVAAGNSAALVTGAAKGREDKEHAAACPPPARDAKRYSSACPLPGVPAFLVYAVLKGFRVARRDRPRLIVCSSIVAAPAAAVLGVALRIPYVVLVHGTEVAYVRRRYRRAFDFLAGRAAMLVANSKATAKLLPDALAARVTVVNPGVRTHRFHSSKPAVVRGGAWVEDGRPVVLSVGRLVRRKGVIEFVRRVLPGLLTEFPDLVYLVAGADPSSSLVHRERPARAIREAVTELGLTDCVRLLGAVKEEELPSLYRCADVFVLPCLEMAEDSEGFGIAVVEAAAAGVPAVATGVGGIAEAVLDGATGLLVAPGDYQAMGEAVAMLLRDGALRCTLGSEAAARARRDLDWSVVIERYSEVFESCLR